MKQVNTFLLIKYFKCATTPEEEVLVREWIAGDTDGSRMKQYKDAHFIYEGMVAHGDNKRIQTAKTAKRGVRFLRIAAGIAAGLVLIAVAGYVAREATLDYIAGMTESIYVPAGKSMEMTLEDGTRLWLNSGTQIEYPKLFARDQRNVRLVKGEAMFDVALDTERPFKVETFASGITVLGTKFNVTAYEEKGEYTTSLLRGKVKITNKLADEEYILNPNERVTLHGRRMVKETFGDASAVECWTNGLIDVSGCPFDEMMDKFELAFNVNIVIERETLPEISYTSGKIRISDGIEHALTVLQVVSGFTYVRDMESNTIYIR